jgi:membrane protease YdiL (CAAX protease family)
MNKKTNSSFDRLWLFFLLTFGFSWILWLPGLLLTYGLINPSQTLTTINSVLQWVGGIGPSLAALALIIKDEGKTGVKDVFKRAFQLKLGYWYFPLFLILPLAVILAHVVNVLLFDGSFPQSGILSEPWWIPVLFLLFLILQFGEELGWRGYALDRLQQRWTAFFSSLLLGAIWAVWHFPMFLSSGFGQHDNHLPFGQFSITVILVSVLITWIQNNTNGSLVPAFVMHALIALTGEVLPLIEKNPNGQGDYIAWIIANFLLFVVVVIVVVFLGHRKFIRE